MGAAGGWLNKKALANVPPNVLNTRIWLIAIWASYCGGLHGFNTAKINGIMTMKSFRRNFGLDEMSATSVTNITGWVTSAMLLGQLGGVIISGPLNERKGRNFCILVAATLYSIGAILMAANLGSITELMIGRVFSGLGSGVGMTTGAIYISEVAPKEVRGTMSTFYNINIMAGVTGAYWINYGSLLHIPSSSSWQWRVPMILQIIPAVALFAGLPFCPESARYLAMRGRLEQAKAILLGLRQIPEDDPYFVAEHTELIVKVSAAQETETGWKAFKTLLHYCAKDESTRKRLIFVLLIQTFFITSGGNSITYYAPTILKSMGLNSEQELLFTAIYGMVKVASVLLYAMLLTDRFGRRPLLLIGATTNLLCLIYLTCYLGLANISGGPSAASWVAIVAICIFAVGYGFGWAPAFSLATSEICPTRTRGTIVTIAFTYQNALNFGITRGFPNMTESMGKYGPFALFAACTFVGVIWVYLAFPECKGRSMETMDQLFNMPWWKVGRSSVRKEAFRDMEQADSKDDLETVSEHIEKT